MTKLDRVGNSDNFNSWGPIVSTNKSARSVKKRLNVCTVMMLLHEYGKHFGC